MLSANAVKEHWQHSSSVFHSFQTSSTHKPVPAKSSNKQTFQQEFGYPQLPVSGDLDPAQKQIIHKHILLYLR